MSPDDPILIAGGGGFIGGHLAQRLARDGYRDVRVVDVKPLEDWFQLIDGFENTKVDLGDLEAARRAVEGRRIVFDLASDMGGIGFIDSHRVECMLSVSIAASLIRASIEAHVDRFFFASSACVYNITLQNESTLRGLREEDAYPVEPEGGYGWEKLFTERLLLNAAAERGLNARIARYHNVYGPMGAWAGGREKAPAAICRKVAEAVATGKREIEIWGDGEQTRSFTYIDDAVDGTLLLAASDIDQPLNVGSDCLVTINRLVDIVEEVAGVRLKRRYRPDAPQGVRARNSDNSRLQSLLGWQPSTSLNEGLAVTYGWIFDQIVAAGSSKRAELSGRR